MILAAQNQALRTKWVRHHIDKELETPTTCSICGLADETIEHVVSECNFLAQKDYKTVRQDKIAAAIHRELCKKHGFEYVEKSDNHQVDKESRALENEEVKILGDFTIQTEKNLAHNKPDLVILTKKEKTAYIVDVGCPFDARIRERERTKIEKYTDLKYELLKVRKGEMTKVLILPVIIGALGTMTKNVQDNLDKLKIDNRVVDLQKIRLLGTSRVLRKVLDS